jgi:hypothetical protein
MMKQQRRRIMWEMGVVRSMPSGKKKKTSREPHSHTPFAHEHSFLNPFKSDSQPFSFFNPSAAHRMHPIAHHSSLKCVAPFPLFAPASPGALPNN